MGDPVMCPKRRFCAASGRWNDFGQMSQRRDAPQRRSFCGMAGTCPAIDDQQWVSRHSSSFRNNCAKLSLHQCDALQEI